MVVRDSFDRDQSEANSVDWLTDHGDALFGFAVRRVGSRSVAEDLVQETFLAAIKQPSPLENIDSRQAWLLAILKNKIVDHFRSLARRQWDHANDDSADTARSADPSAFLQEQELQAALRQCIAKLPAPMRQAFELRVVHDLDVGETAELLGISRNTLAARLYRARLAVRDCLAGFWSE